jgi:hypothetical protein
MRILIVNSDYHAFLEWLYAQRPGLAERSYHEQLQARNDSLFGVSDFYPRNLRALGHEAEEVHINNLPLQLAWARERGLEVRTRGPFRPCWRRGWVPWVRRGESSWHADILRGQIEEYRPDVILSHVPFGVGASFWRKLTRHFRLLSIQHAASPLNGDWDWSVYDLAISSFPPTLDWFRARGVRAEYFRLGFEPAVLPQLDGIGRPVSVSFVGSLFEIHRARIEWLEYVCRALKDVDLGVWTNDIANLREDSPIRQKYRGPAWGKAMYRVLRDSRITLNHHGSIAPFANNMRLYEATGVGTLLVTDWKENLGELFEPGREVVAYRDPEDCVRQVRYYLEHEPERKAIAGAGQHRTLLDHSYLKRMRELVAVFERYL